MTENELLFIVSFGCMFTFCFAIFLAGTRIGRWVRDDILRKKDD